MNGLLCNILSFCILNKQKRHNFRNKHNTNKRLNKMLFDIENKVLFLKYIIDNTIDIKKFPSQLSKNINQQVNLELLNIFDKICRKYGLRYWLDFGTLIGAVRHNGFIPWDDDVDVGMPRKDYEKFLNIVKNFPKEHNIGIFFENKNINFLVAKFVYSGLPGMIDIFPYDQYFKEDIESNFSEKYDKVIDIYGKEILKIDKNSIIKEHSDIAKRILNEYILKNKIENEKGFLFWGLEFKHHWDNKVFLYDTIFPLQECKFENLCLFIPNNYDKYLKSIYGDYTVFPDYTHNHEIAFHDIVNSSKNNEFEMNFNNLKTISANWK